MKKVLSVLLSVAFMLSQFIPVMAAETGTSTTQPKMISGNITKETEDSVLVKPYANDNEVILKITDGTYLIDAVSGSPLKLKDRKGDQITAYYGPIETKSLPPQSNAVAIICSIPQDYRMPYYAKVEAIEKGDNQVMVTINGGSVIATIKGDVPISPFKTKNTVTIGNIQVGTDLLIWSDTTTMSFPGKTNVTKAVILGSSSTTTENATTESTSFQVEKKVLPADSKKVTGELPLFTGISDKTFSDKLNALVDTVYENAVKETSNKDNMNATLTYESFTHGNYTSFVIHTAVSSGNTSSDKISTIVLDNTKNKQYMLEDILDPNAYKLANMFISKEISKADEGAYFTDENQFKGIKSEPNFYIQENGNVAIVFDKYSIAPGVMGTPTFSFPMDSVVTYELTTDQAYMEGYTTMIPLRQITDAYGYNLTWDGMTKAVSVTKGDVTHTIKMNENLYDQRELEFAPTLHNEKTYVPLSYFEVILGGCYTAYDSKIVFSMFK